MSWYMEELSINCKVLIIIIKQFLFIKLLSHVKHGSILHILIQLMPAIAYEVGGIIIRIFKLRKPRHREVQ